MNNKPCVIEDGIVAGNVYDKYGSKNPITRYLMHGFNRAIAELVSLTHASEAHEVGCGEGHLTCWLAENNRISIRASDFSNEIIEKAKVVVSSAKLDIPFKVQSIYDLQAGEDSAELIVCCEVLEHLPDPARAMEILAKLANPYLLVSVPREPLWRILNIMRGGYLTHLGNTPGHIQHWSSRSFLNMLTQYVDIVAVRTPLPWTVALCRVRDNAK